MRILAALVPSVEAVRHLVDALTAASALLPQVEWTSSDDWHVYLMSGDG